MSINRTSLSIGLLAGTLLSSTVALAASGTVTGRLWLYIKQGQYCDDIASPDSCVGAKWLKSINETYQPISEAWVELADQDGKVIGQSSTDVTGVFSISWSRSTAPSSARVRWVYRHVDNRFLIVPPDAWDSVWYTSTGSFAVVSGGTKDLGNRYFGDTETRQAYDSAFRMWYHALQSSGIAQSKFTGVKIAANDPNVTIASAGVDGIRLAPEDARYPNTVHHELGHVMHFRAKAGMVSPSLYTWPDPCPSGTCEDVHHRFDSAEWKNASFAEGVAHFLGLVASYGYDAPRPEICTDSLTACPDNGSGAPLTFDVEFSATNCDNNADRQEINALRYLWDVYDTVNDTVYWGYDDHHGALDASGCCSYAAMIYALASFPNGTGNHQINEPWNSSFTAIDNHDGYSAEDYAWRLLVDTTRQRINNCGP